jgi:hypothetical protein
MHHREATTTKSGPRGAVRSGSVQQSKVGSRYTVGLSAGLAHQVAQYAQTVDMSMSKALAALVRLGLQNHENQKRAFFKKLRENLANDDPKHEDRLVDEFRTLILGR